MFPVALLFAVRQKTRGSHKQQYAPPVAQPPAHQEDHHYPAWKLNDTQSCPASPYLVSFFDISFCHPWWGFPFQALLH